MTVFLALLGVVATALLAVAGFGSWSAARKANQTAVTLKQIEDARRREELAPRFQITCAEQSSSLGRAYLHVTLMAGGSDHLDEVVITILDDGKRDHWGQGLPAEVSQETADDFVWGPWEFNTGASEQVVNRRTTRPRAYSRPSGTNWERLSLTRTRPGPWMEGQPHELWERDNPDPIRLLFACRRDGYEPWSILYEVSTDQELDAGTDWSADT